MDEISFFFNMSQNKTLETETILIKTYNQEKWRIKILLCVTADDVRLTHLLIFKAKSDGKIEQELNKDKYIVNKKCLISCIYNALPTEKIMTKWCKEIWLIYLINNETFNDDGLVYLMIDKASSHFPEDILNNNNTYKAIIDIAYIPSGMTRYLYPIYVSINKPARLL